MLMPRGVSPGWFTLEKIQGNIIFSVNAVNTKETVAILLHYDTIPPDDLNKFNQPNTSKEGGKIYGLGVTSAKAAIASVLSCIKKNKDHTPIRSFKIIFSCDETTGSLVGSQNLVKNYPSKVFADMYWIPDCTDSYISIGTYHVIPIKIVLKGVGGHPAYNIVETAENAPLSTARLLESVLFEFESIKNKYTQKYMKPVLSITGIKSFGQPNVISDSAEIYLDLRFPPDGSDIDSLIRPLLENIKNTPLFKDLDISYYKGFISDLSSDIVESFINIAENITDRKLDTKVEKGSHDGSFYGYILNKPVIGFLPGGKNLHSKDEYLIEESLEYLEGIFEKFIYGI